MSNFVQKAYEIDISNSIQRSFEIESNFDEEKYYKYIDQLEAINMINENCKLFFIETNPFVDLHVYFRTL